MNTRITLITLCLLPLIAQLHADPTPGPRRQPRNVNMPEREPGERRGPHPQVEAYLQHLKEKDPEKYAEMEKLRKDNPAAFREELRRKAWERREQFGDQRRPRQAPHPLQEEIKRVQEAQTAEEKEAAVAALRLKITERVEKNQQEREQAIEKIRLKLKQLEEQNEQERIRREEIIDLHLQRILENLPPSPADDTPDE